MLGWLRNLKAYNLFYLMKNFKNEVSLDGVLYNSLHFCPKPLFLGQGNISDSPKTWSCRHYTFPEVNISIFNFKYFMTVGAVVGWVGCYPLFLCLWHEVVLISINLSWILKFIFYLNHTVKKIKQKTSLSKCIEQRQSKLDAQLK